jgi:hypothetical protein
MNNSYLDIEPAALCAVPFPEEIMLSAEPIIGTTVDRPEAAESAPIMTRKASQSEPVTAADKTRSWYERLLEMAANNPPHLF